MTFQPRNATIRTRTLTRLHKSLLHIHLVIVLIEQGVRELLHIPKSRETRVA
jgi:hypothetical protein